MTGLKQEKWAVVAQTLCVACGCCERVCPKAAIRVYKGCEARVEVTRCVGCKRCVTACPASVITMQEAVPG